MKHAAFDVPASSAASAVRRWIGLKTLIRRECGVILRYWSVTFAPPVITTVLYFTIFGEVIGRHLGSFEGFDYVQYIAPGVIMLWVITYSYAHPAGGFLGARIFGFLQEVLVSPQPDWVVMLGYVIAGVLRGVVVGVIVLITTLFYTQLPIHSVIASFAVLVLVAFVSAVGGFIAGLCAKEFEHVYGIQTLILAPLIYIGGAFSPLSMLPEWAQTLSLANPMFYVVNAFRYAVLGVSDVPLGMAFGVLLLVGFVLCSWALFLMNRGTGIRS